LLDANPDVKPVALRKTGALHGQRICTDAHWRKGVISALVRGAFQGKLCIFVQQRHAGSRHYPARRVRYLACDGATIDLGLNNTCTEKEADHAQTNPTIQLEIHPEKKDTSTRIAVLCAASGTMVYSAYLDERERHLPMRGQR
jgi:hypothetical protein